MQQIDAQGPVVVERISTQFADLTCSPENSRKLVEALHAGTSVTLEANGKTATFTPTGTLGYGEAYIALSLAAEALRNAGVSGCATPDQWQAVLLGGPLTAAGTTTTTTSQTASASSSSSFPGILALHAQGQGWGQIAHTTNVQLGSVVSSARTSLQLESETSSSLSPTGRSSSDFNRPHSGKNDSNSASDPASVDKASPRIPEADRSDKTDHDTDGTGKPGNGKDDSARPASDAASSSATPPAPRGGR